MGNPDWLHSLINNQQTVVQPTVKTNAMFIQSLLSKSLAFILNKTPDKRHSCFNPRFCILYIELKTILIIEWSNWTVLVNCEWIKRQKQYTRIMTGYLWQNLVGKYQCKICFANSKFVLNKNLFLAKDRRRPWKPYTDIHVII